MSKRPGPGSLLAAAVLLAAGCAREEPAAAPPESQPLAPAAVARELPPEVLAEDPLGRRRLPGSAAAARPQPSDVRLPPFPAIAEDAPVEEVLLTLEERLRQLHYAVRPPEEVRP